MFPSYQTVPLANISKANAPKEERSSTPVPRMTKVAVAAMVGMALVVGGYSYGASTTHPAMMIDITTTRTTAAANLVRGGVRNGETYGPGDACYDIGSDEEACTGREGCYWYPHWASSQGWCSSSSGVDCGVNNQGLGFRARDCATCPYYESVNNQGMDYCHGDCERRRQYDWGGGFYYTCEPKSK